MDFFQLVYDTNRAGNDPSKDVILNNNQPRLNTADLLQNPHRLKWANKMVDERTKDDKNSMRGGKKNRETKWAMFETTKNTKDEQKTLRKYKNTQRQLGNFWRHDNVSYFNFLKLRLSNIESFERIGAYPFF